MSSQKKEKSLFCQDNIVLGVSGLAALGVVAVYWWTVPKIAALEAQCSAEKKHREKLEKKVDDLSKRVARMEHEQKRHGSDIRNIQDDIDTHQVRLDTLSSKKEEPQRKKRPGPSPIAPLKEKSRAKKHNSYTPESSVEEEPVESLDSSEDIDYQAIYDAEKAQEKKSSRARR